MNQIWLYDCRNQALWFWEGNARLIALPDRVAADLQGKYRLGPPRDSGGQAKSGAHDPQFWGYVGVYRIDFGFQVENENQSSQKSNQLKLF